MTNEQQLETLLILYRTQLFEKCLKLNNMYTEHLVEQYKVYQESMLGDEIADYINTDCMEPFDVAKELYKLLRFMKDNNLIK